jgi:hypothetical protein
MSIAKKSKEKLRIKRRKGREAMGLNNIQSFYRQEKKTTTKKNNGGDVAMAKLCSKVGSDHAPSLCSSTDQHRNLIFYLPSLLPSSFSNLHLLFC